MSTTEQQDSIRLMEPEPIQSIIFSRYTKRCVNIGTANGEAATDILVYEPESGDREVEALDWKHSRLFGKLLALIFPGRDESSKGSIAVLLTEPVISNILKILEEHDKFLDGDVHSKFDNLIDQRLHSFDMQDEGDLIESLTELLTESDIAEDEDAEREEKCVVVEHEVYFRLL